MKLDVCGNMNNCADIGTIDIRTLQGPTLYLQVKDL